jgi:PAS domain S-box-containing protein
LQEPSVDATNPLDYLYRALKWGLYMTPTDQMERNELDVLRARIVKLEGERHGEMHVLQTLRDSENRHRDLFDMCPFAVVIHNLEAVAYINHAGVKLLGAQCPEEILGRPVWSFVPSDRQSWLKQEWLRQHKERTCSELRIESLIRLDGQMLPVKVLSGPVLFDGKPAIYVVLRDISERVRREEELQRERKQTEAERERLISRLEKQNAELERFAYTVSHELRTPLITTINYSGALKQGLQEGNTNEVMKDAERIEVAGKRMYRLLNDVLELARIGRVVNPPEEFQLEPLLQEVLTILASRLAAGNVQVDISPHLPTLYADRVRLLEVLQNLVENAIKYMGPQPEPHIEIGARQDGDNIVCFVRDNGIGIDPDYHEKIFGLFDQLDQKVEGSGIGLALVKRIIEIHGGRIWVESEGQGRGATFCFTLAAKSESVERPGAEPGTSLCQ